MNKRLFDKRCHYSIRKFAIGAASVMIGASIFGISAVQAEEVASSNTQTGETTVHQAQPLDKLPDDVAAAIAKADENGGREFVKPKAESTEDKVIRIQNLLDLLTMVVMNWLVLKRKLQIK